MLSLILIIIDQAIKLFISHYYMDADVILLPSILLFRPFLHTNLWIPSIIDYKAPIYVMLVLPIFALTIIIFAYRYLSYLWNQRRNLLNGMLTFSIAGITCMFVDTMFWGGSLDFIRLFDWFTFDFKDAYLTIGGVCVFLYGGIYLFKVYRKLSKEERKQTGFLLWIKRGMPSHT